MTRASTSKRRRNSRPRAEEVTVEEEFRPSDSTRTKRVRSLTVRPVHPVHLSSESMTVPKPLSWKGGPAAILKPDFFRVDALDLAPRLLGKFLRRDDVVLRITEVEAYRHNDTACHGRFGVTSRTAPLFGPGGHAYVYLCYGLHIMLNVVADKEGVGAAVLIRSCAPIVGLESIQSRRGNLTEKPVLLTGPGKIGQALGLSTAWSNHPLYVPGGLEILDGPIPEKILVGPRVGIDYAAPEHVRALWRFAIADTPWVGCLGFISHWVVFGTVGISYASATADEQPHCVWIASHNKLFVVDF